MALFRGWPRRSQTEAPFLVSFSGIDGAGKTTQIEQLSERLKGLGLRVVVINFWEDVATFRWMRELFTHTIFKGERGIGSPGRPVQKRDKNVRSWYLQPIRLLLCALDGLALTMLVIHLRRRQHADVVIFDRYVYDELANVNASTRPLRFYLRWLVKIMPHPDVALLLDVDPVLARERKPEYPIEFLYDNRAAYLTISTVGGLRVIPPGTAECVAACVRSEVEQRMPANSGAPTAALSHQ